MTAQLCKNKEVVGEINWYYRGVELTMFASSTPALNHIDFIQKSHDRKDKRLDIRDCSFEIRAGRFEGRVIKFLTSFLGGFKIYNTCFGGL